MKLSIAVSALLAALKLHELTDVFTRDVEPGLLDTFQHSIVKDRIDE